jgi:sugar phosphate isomerase/epimerase
MRLGISIRYSLAKGSGITSDQLLPLVEKSAIEDVEIDPSLEGKELEWIAEFLKTSRLRLWSVHGLAGHEPLSSPNRAIRNEALLKAQSTMEVAGALGAHVVVLHASDEPISEHDRAERMAHAKNSLASLLPVAQTSNLVIAVEYLPRTCLGNALPELMNLIEGLPRYRVGVCLDVNHVKEATSLPRIIHELDERLITLHISDYDGVDERHWLPGKGIIDWPAVWDALEDVGYNGPWLYESGAVYEDPKANIRMIEDNFRHWLSLQDRAERGHS